MVKKNKNNDRIELPLLLQKIEGRKPPSQTSPLLLTDMGAHTHVWVQVSTGSAGHPRREGLRGPKRVSGQSVPQWGHLRQPGDERAVQVRLHHGLLRGQLRAHAGGADTEAQHGGAGSHTRLLTNHTRYCYRIY